MKSKEQEDHKAVSADRRSVISLGENLFQLNQQAQGGSWSIPRINLTQQNIILDKINRFAIGQATVWFAE